MKELTEDQAFAVVAKVLMEKDGDLTIDQITPEASLIDDLGFDSLDATEVLMNIEEELNIDLEQDTEFVDHLFGDRPGGKITVQNIIDTIVEETAKTVTP